MRFVIISLALFLMNMSAFAVETKFCVITSDVDDEVTDLLIDVGSDGSIDSMRLYKTLEGKVLSDDSYPSEEVIKNGIVAVEDGGRDIVVLRTEEKFSTLTGGLITLDYLYNGIRGSRKQMNFKVSKINDKFVLLTTQGSKVTRLAFQANRAMILGVIGIKGIVPSSN